MYVACSTRCFAGQPLEWVLRHIAEMEFNKVDVAISEASPGLKPSEIVRNPDLALHRIRHGASLMPAALELDIQAETAAEYRRQLEVLCRLAKQLTAACVTIPPAAAGTDFDTEVARLSDYTRIAQREGVILTIETRAETLADDPQTAVRLCQAVPGLGLTLDPSYYICGRNGSHHFDVVFPHVQHVHLRDTGRKPTEFQVRVGQGEVEYGRIVTQLQRYDYDRALTVDILGDRDNPFNVETEVRKLKLLLESLV